MKEHGVSDVEALSEGLLERYLEDRLNYHHGRGHARATFLQEISAIATLERGLSAFSVLHREVPVGYDYHPVRWRFARKAKILVSRSNGHTNRAVLDVGRLLAAIDDPRHHLMARLQIEAGCRAEGAGAPRKGNNPFTMANFRDPRNGEPLGVVDDPVTGRRVTELWTKEKGGKGAFKYCSIPLGDLLCRYLQDHGALEEGYDVYLRAVNDALARTGQSAR